MSHFFVTGSRGFIGSHLVSRLLQMGHNIETDLRYLHSRRYDSIVHLAARTSISTDFDPEIFESNIILTNEVFKCPCRIIAASSCSSQFLTNPYAYSKRYLEHLCTLRPNAVALRFFNVYGIGASRGIIWWLMQQPDGAKINVRGPELVRDYIEVNEVVDEIVKFLYTCAEKVYDIGSGTGCQTMDVVNLYQELSGKRFDISVSEAGDNEPLSMISNRVCGSISLQEGLKKLINEKQG